VVDAESHTPRVYLADGAQPPNASHWSVNSFNLSCNHLDVALLDSRGAPLLLLNGGPGAIGTQYSERALVAEPTVPADWHFSAGSFCAFGSNAALVREGYPCWLAGLPEIGDAVHLNIYRSFNDTIDTNENPIPWGSECDSSLAGISAVDMTLLDNEPVAAWLNKNGSSGKYTLRYVRLVYEP
jgi:hypothetical protein